MKKEFNLSEEMFEIIKKVSQREMMLTQWMNQMENNVICLTKIVGGKKR